MGVHGLVPAPTPAESEFYLKGNGTWSLPTTYGIMNGATEAAAGAAGLVPVPTIGDQVKFLRGDGVWAIPTDTTYADYKGATTSEAGVAGLVPAATSGNQELFLRGDATWQKPTDTTYAPFTGSAAGKLVPMPTTEQATSNYVLTGAGCQFGSKYNTDTNTTYNNFTSAAAGLVPMAKSGSTNLATANYVLTGAGWKDGTKYNTDTTYSFSNNNPTLDWGKKFTIGTVGGTALTVTMPNNPNTNTTYGNMIAASSAVAGAAGLVPAPTKGQQGLFLRGDAKWATPTNTWKLNTADQEGYVQKGSGYPNRFWTTDSNGAPGWRLVYSIGNTFKAAASNAAGTAGLVPAPDKATYSRRGYRFLAESGGWTDLPAATSSYFGGIKINAGTANGTTANCPVNCIYFKY